MANSSSQRRRSVKKRQSMLTAIEVAQYLRVHVMTVYRMVQRGEMPAVRVGSRWRFRREHIDRWLLSQREDNSISPPAGSPRR